MELSLSHADDASISAQELDCCRCEPCSSLHDDHGVEYEQTVLLPVALKEQLHTVLGDLFPRSTPLSVLVLHLSQQEYAHSAAQPERRCYHAPSGLLQQVMTNVRRVIRVGDQQIVHENVGAAIIFPDVDQHGVQGILERVYRRIDLLQAETVVPPLTRETTIILGVGSYPAAGPSLDELLSQMGCVARRLILRPVIASYVSQSPSTSQERLDSPVQQLDQSGEEQPVVPFMELPPRLPQRLKDLVPYHLAQELHCAPVGQEHHCLTVAMIDPGNRESIRRLQIETGMRIFPVSCIVEDLDALLAKRW